jgi:hypothetical protein
MVLNCDFWQRNRVQGFERKNCEFGDLCLSVILKDRDVCVSRVDSVHKRLIPVPEFRVIALPSHGGRPNFVYCSQSAAISICVSMHSAQSGAWKALCPWNLKRLGRCFGRSCNNLPFRLVFVCLRRLQRRPPAQYRGRTCADPGPIEGKSLVFDGCRDECNWHALRCK